MKLLPEKKKLHKKVKKVKKVATTSIRLLGCAGVGVVGAAIDTPALLTIAIVKSPVLLWKGWKQNIINMESCAEQGTCPWPLCIPTAAAMLLLWPLRVAGSISSALFYGLAEGMNGGVVAYQENSIACGLNHIVAAIAEYDEYTNDVIDLREGSCLPRPTYHCHSPDEKQEQRENGVTLNIIREFQMGKLLEYLTSKQARMRAASMVEEDVLGKPLVTKVSWTLFHFLIDSDDDGGVKPEQIKERAPGVVEYDPLEILESFVLGEDEEMEELEPELDQMRKAAIQGFGRRIRGIASFVSADPEFRRQYGDYVKAVIAASRDMISFE